MAVLKSRGRSFQFTVLGGGPLRRKLMGLAESLAVEDRIDFRGPAPHEAVIDALGTHHVFVLPGVEAPSGAVEAQSLALVEAQAAGLPVVASAVGGIPETIGEGAGRLVPPGDPDALADALDATLNERPQWDAIGERGRQHVLDHFDRRVLSRELLELYRTLN
jgi:glycosyltransferase involved in cell wall biosynthesis